MITMTDLFCGAGGSSSGAEAVPGVRVRMATNHWALAIETHNTNLPHVDHDIADVSGVDPRRYPYTDLAWFSPECTYWSQARGDKQDFAQGDEQAALFGEDGRPLPPEAAQRSRALMEDVPRFAEHHRYRAVIVENVPDILKWTGLPTWINRMRRLGYRSQVVVLNSAFAHQLGMPAPQLRERFYAIFTQERYPAPDLNRWTRPWVWCPSCQQVVRGVFALRKPGPLIGRMVAYGRQYDYRCPSVSCRNTIAYPYVLPAAVAIDWTNRGTRIGDRDRPLSTKTLSRIRAGLARYMPAPVRNSAPTRLRFAPLLVPVEGREGKQARPVDVPMRGQTTRNETALLIPAGGTWNDEARSVEVPLRTRTTRESEGVLVIPLRGTNTAKPITAPLDTVAAGGNHHALLMRNLTARGDQGQMCTPTSEPARTMTASNRQSLVWHPDLLRPYDTSRPPQQQPTPTVRVDVDDCLFRMLTPQEIKLAMAFAHDYVLLGTKREQVRLAGNAVTPPAARDLVAAVVEAITGADITPQNPPAAHGTERASVPELIAD